MSSSTAAAATDPTDDSGPPAIVDTAINTMAQSQSTLEDDGSTMAYPSVRHIIIFLAKTIGDLKDIADRRGKKKLVQFTKTVLYREIMRRDPNAKVNKNNTSLDAMWNLLPALTDEGDELNIVATKQPQKQ
jgi:hypothetical protein